MKKLSVKIQLHEIINTREKLGIIEILEALVNDDYIISKYVQ